MSTCPEHQMITTELREIKEAQKRIPGWTKWAIGMIIPIIILILAWASSMAVSVAVSDTKIDVKNVEMTEVQKDLKGLSSRMDKIETKIDYIVGKVQ